jgi:glycosyltransferase involved in cell wall biosynthesis
MRILVIHNQLWAHYKSKLFSEIYSNLKSSEPDSDFSVAHIALHEASRSVMKDDETVKYEYPYQVLFNRSLDSVGFKERVQALFRAFNEFRPTILNVTGYFDYAQVALMVYARMKGVKVVLSSESSTMDHARSPVKERIKSWIVGNAHAFFCFGKSSANYLLSLGVKESQITVRHAAVIDEDIIRKNFDKAKESFSIDLSSAIKRQFIYVGRLSGEKNLELLIEAFKSIKETSAGAAWSLLFVGDGPARKNLELLSGDYLQNKSIIFAGGHPWYQVPTWLAQSDVLILPSKSEPWGLVVNEAMVCGMPVIVSEKCGCSEDLVKNEINGFTFSPDSKSQLESAMQFFAENPEKIKVMGEASLALIKPFSSKTVANEMVACYKNLG